MWPTLYGVSGTVPLTAWAWAARTPRSGTGIAPTAAAVALTPAAAVPTVMPSWARKSRRLTSGAISSSFVEGLNHLTGSRAVYASAAYGVKLYAVGGYRDASVPIPWALLPPPLYN